MIRLLSLLFGHKLCLFLKQIFHNLLDLEVQVRVTTLMNASQREKHKTL